MAENFLFVLSHFSLLYSSLILLTDEGKTGAGVLCKTIDLKADWSNGVSAVRWSISLTIIDRKVVYRARGPRN